MKKLMLTSALAGLVIASGANAQTTITGEMRVTHKAISAEPSSATTSGRGFGTEQQINFAHKGKLNVGGLDYAAGFSIENDGAQSSTLFNENNYIDITNASSGTTLSFSIDHIQRNDSDRSAANIFGFAPSEYSSGGPSGTLMTATPGPGVGQSQSIALLQDVGKLGKLSYAYAPSLTDKTSETGTLSTGQSSSEALTEATEESAYEVGFVGSLGVTGLTVDAFKSKQKKMGTNAVEAEGENLGLRYSTGPVTLGVAQKKWNDEAAATKLETKEKNYGLSYAVNKDVTVGILHATAEKTAVTNKQKLTAIQLGYNLGPVALTVGVAKNDDIAGTNGADSDMIMTRLIGAF
jgi:hypothetical protein